ncbi:MAG: efflux transporter outer membrane subunit [Arenicella sp.]
MTKTILITVAAIALNACTVGPNFNKPKLHTNDWIDRQANHAINTTWWTVFNDPMLDDLVIRVASDNLDIAIAQQRILESRALRGVSRAALLPSLGTSSSYVRSKKNNAIQDAYEVGFDAAWEIDFVGGNRRAIEASTARLESTKAFKHHIILSVIAETARNYIELRGHQKRIALLVRNVALQQQTINLLRASFDNGLSREVDVTRAESQLANTQSLIPNIAAEVRAGTYRLAMLTGKQPDALYKVLEKSKPLPAPEEVVPLGLKSDLLKRRPDIQVAEKKLAAATADIGVAVAKLYPSFSLTGSLGFSAADFSNLFKNASETFLFTPSIHFPIFSAGKIRAQINVAEIRHSIAAIEYEKTLLTALKETESILVRYAKEQETRAQLKRAVKSSTRSVELSNVLYKNGLTNFVGVLDAEQQLTTTEDALVQSETRVLTNLIALYKALGGGWEVFEPATPTNAAAQTLSKNTVN